MKQIIFLLMLLLTPITTWASGMSVFPDKLQIYPQEIKNLNIQNPSPDVLLFEVYADDFKDLIEITPRSFTLESGTHKKVAISLINGKGKNAGRVLSTHISITANALSQTDANVTIGAKIPITLNIDAISNHNVFYTVLYTLSSALVLFCLFFWQKVFKLFKKLSE